MAGSDLKPIRQPESAVAQVYARHLCEKNTVVVFLLLFRKCLLDLQCKKRLRWQLCDVQ